MNEKELLTRQIATRIKSARLDAKLDVDGAAEAWGVSKSTQYNYEAGDRLPDAMYLHEMWKSGVDITYVVTGSEASRRDHLAAGEQHLLKLWIQLDPHDRATVAAVIEMALRGKAAR